MNIYTVKMPDIGEGVVEGEVIEWLKKVVDMVHQEEPVVVVMTDKATVELPSPKPGRLTKQYYTPGEMAQRDNPLYDIETEETIAAASAPEEPKVAHVEPAAPPKAEGQVLATPYVRGLAKERGIDLNTLQGTGPDGRIVEVDLATTDSMAQPLIGIRRQMADKMALSKRTIPHFSYFEQVDASRLVDLYHNLQSVAEKEQMHLTFMPFFIRALSLALTKYPEVNSTLEGQTLHIHKEQNIGIAMATPQGLIVPVLKGVQNLSLRDIAREFNLLKQRATQHKLTSSDMKGATISLSNFGVLGGGGLWATPIINPPEAAILALAKIQKQPFVKKGQLVVAPLLNLSWSFDHRFIDGHKAAEISHAYAGFIHNPASLL